VANSTPIPREENAVETPRNDYHEGRLESLLPRGRKLDLRRANTAGRMPKIDVHPYVRALFHAGFNTTSLMMLSRVEYRSKKDFYQNPHKYIGILDMMFIHSFTGITLDRQIDLLFYGMVPGEYYSGIYANIESYTGSETSEPPAPELFGSGDIAPPVDIQEPKKPQEFDLL